MEPHLQKRIALFYLGGVINVFLGLYVLFEVKSDKAVWLVIFFFAFAAIDFWFPHAIRKKWRADQERLRAPRVDAAGGSGQK